MIRSSLADGVDWLLTSYPGLNEVQMPSMFLLFSQYQSNFLTACQKFRVKFRRILNKLFFVYLHCLFQP